MSAEASLQRAHVYLEDAQDSTLDFVQRLEALDAARATLIEARRARVPPETLLPIFATVCATGAASSSHLARAVVPNAVEDLCLRDLRTFAKTATPFLVRALHDEHVLVATRAVRALTTLFRKLIGFAVLIRVQEPAAVDAVLSDATLAVWLQMETKAVSLIQAPDEGLRKAATKFAETVILAFSYSGGPGSPDHFTLDYITANTTTSPLLDPKSLEKIGARCVTALSTLVSACLSANLHTVRPGLPTITGLPPFTFMTAISVLGNLVRRRRNLLETTLPPLLTIVTTLTAPVCPAFDALSDGQRQSIITVLRFTLNALRAYTHARTGRAGADIARATNDLAAYERTAEQQRKDRLQQQLERPPPEPERPLSAPQKRQRAADPARPFPRLPAPEAFALTQTLAHSMPPQELVAFVMTRLLLNIPPDDSVPGVDISLRRERERAAVAALEEPAQKRQRKSRFGAKEHENAAPAKKIVAVRKVAPPVVPARLSDAAAVKLVTICCRRIMKREAEANAAGAGPLRLQLLARLLTRLARMDGDVARGFCDEACSFIVERIETNILLAQAWLHCLICAEELEAMKSVEADVKMDDRMAIKPGTEGEPRLDSVAEGQGAPVQPKAESIVETDVVEIKHETPVSGDEVTQKEALGSGGNPEAGASNPATGNDDDESEVELDEEEEEDLLVDPAYERVLVGLLTMVKEKYSSTGDAFIRLVVDAPVLTESVIELLDKCCRDPSLIKLGLSTLRDVVLERSGNDRQRSLSLLLDFTTNEDEVLRGPAIRLVANKLFVECNGDVPRSIEAYATDFLKTALDSVSESPSSEDVNALDKASLLLTALCGQKHELLRVIASMYTQASSGAQTVLLSRAKDLASHIGMSSPPILQLISGKLLSTAEDDNEEESAPSGKQEPLDDGLEDLALDVLRAVLKKFGKPSEELVEAARLRYEMKQNTDFIIAVLPGLQKEAILQYFSAVVDASYTPDETNESQETTNVDASPEDGNSTTKKRATFKDIIGTIMAVRPPALSAAELLIELHNIDPTPAASSAIRACFELKSIYKQESVAQAIQQLLEKTVTPGLFMRTVHLARIFHPELEKYLTDTVMMRLIDKQVWKKELLWEGYLRYCAEVKERSVRALLSLPAAPLGDALKRQGVLRAVFRDMMSNQKNAKRIPAKHRKVVAAAIKRTD